MDWRGVRHRRKGLTMDTTEKAIGLARGCYQRAIATGHARLSGSDLKGVARKYGGRYCRSRNNFLARCDAAGIKPVITGGTSATGPRIIIGWTEK